MTILGLGQIVREHPETRDAYLPAMRAAAARMVDPRTLGYAARRWGKHGIERMRPGEGHAYLGYINLALGMLRAIDPETPYALRCTTVSPRRWPSGWRSHRRA